MNEGAANVNGRAGRDGSKPKMIMGIVLIPISLLILVLLTVIGIASLPVTYVFNRVIEPRRTRRSMQSAGRMMDESECVARLQRGDGSVIVHRLDCGWLSGMQDRVWYTDNVVEAPSAPDEQPSLDALDDAQARELAANVMLWERLYRKYARTNWGESKLVRASGAMAFVQRIRAECPGARVVSIVRCKHLLGPVAQCRACEYPLADSESWRCPKCGKRNALSRPSRG